MVHRSHRFSLGLHVATDPKAAQSGEPRPFDVKTVEYLIGLMGKHDLSEISLGEGEHRIRLRKGFAPAAAHYAQALTTPAPLAATPSAPAEPAKPAKNLLEIKSPMVGTYYSKPAPDKPDYVALGGRVGPTTIVCKLEAMKIFNDLVAEVSGTIAEVCVKNGEAVDYNRVLFLVDPS